MFLVGLCVAGETLVAVPRRLAVEVRRRGLSLEDAVLEALSRYLGLDPETVAESRLELAERYLEEGRRLADRDPVQASEKLYKAAEECVKALAEHLKLEEVLARVGERGRWTVADLDKAARAVAERLGGWVLDAWDHAWTLHVWGFHEAKLDTDAVKARIPYIEKLVRETTKTIRKHENNTPTKHKA